MSLCIFDHSGGCANMNVGELFGKRCIEADNLLKNEQTLCKHRVVKSNNAMSNDICLYLFEGKCSHYFCVAHNKSCIQNSGEVCGFFIPAYEYEFKKQDEKETTKSDTVMHPSHYTQGDIECIKAIEASMTPEEFQGYCKGNVMKYVWRFREKNGLEDLKKARVYLEWMVESKEKQEQNTH